MFVSVPNFNALRNTVLDSIMWGVIVGIRAG